MTLREKLIVTAYTGILMTEWDIFRQYAEELLGRPIWSHEFGCPPVSTDLREAVRAEFLELCEETEDDWY